MKVLSEKEAVEFYQENGYCVIERILSADECGRALEMANAIAKKQITPFLPVINPDREVTFFRELLCHPKVVCWLEIFQGMKIDALQSMLYFKPPGQLGRDLHQDNHYAQAEYGAYIGTWIPLEDSDRENGGLLVYPGSHREGLLEIVEDKERVQTNAGGFKNDRGTACVVPFGYEKKYLEAKAGSCVFIHGNLIHGSEENLSKTRFRHVFAGHYIKQGSAFIPGTHAKRMVIDVYGK